MMKKFLLILCVALLAACSAPRGKVLFIGIDGLASWCLETALDSIPDQLPNFARLRDEGLWTMEKRAVYQTSSAINWASILMGVPTEMHGYRRWNSDSSAFTPYAVSAHGMPPTVFTLLQEQRPAARSVCIYDWNGIAPLIDTLAVTEHQFVKYRPDSLSSIDYTKEYGVPVIEKGMPDLFFFYIVDVDEMGHKYGWGSPEYYASLVRADEAVGLLLDALAASSDSKGTAVVLTSDHGGKPDKKHGTYDLRDFRTPLFIRNGERKGEISSFMMQYDVASVLAQLLDLEIPAEWRGRVCKEMK